MMRPMLWLLLYVMPAAAPHYLAERKMKDCVLPLNGIVSDIDLNLAVIDCNGVGYAVNTTTNTLSRLKLNDRAKLYISECIKEDSFDLYGFATLSEKRCFEMLLGVSGIGPKAAQAILCAATPEGLALAIMNGDDKAITAAQGVGKKSPSVLYLSLKTRFPRKWAAHRCPRCRLL